MALWQSDLSVSWRAQWISLLAHGLLALLVLLMPWSINYTLLWILLLLIVVFSCVRSQRRIHACQGTFKLLEERCVYWKGHQWRMVRKPWIIDSGIMLKLKRQGKRGSLHLWLAADSIDGEEWRDLRRLLLQQQANSRQSH